MHQFQSNPSPANPEVNTSFPNTHLFTVGVTKYIGLYWNDIGKAGGGQYDQSETGDSPYTHTCVLASPCRIAIAAGTLPEVWGMTNKPAWLTSVQRMRGIAKD